MPFVLQGDEEERLINSDNYKNLPISEQRKAIKRLQELKSLNPAQLNQERNKFQQDNQNFIQGTANRFLNSLTGIPRRIRERQDAGRSLPVAAGLSIGGGLLSAIDAPFEEAGSRVEKSIEQSKDKSFAGLSPEVAGLLTSIGLSIPLALTGPTGIAKGVRRVGKKISRLGLFGKKKISDITEDLAKDKLHTLAKDKTHTLDKIFPHGKIPKHQQASTRDTGSKFNEGSLNKTKKQKKLNRTLGNLNIENSNATELVKEAMDSVSKSSVTKKVVPNAVVIKNLRDMGWHDSDVLKALESGTIKNLPELTTAGREINVEAGIQYWKVLEEIKGSNKISDLDRSAIALKNFVDITQIVSDSIASQGRSLQLLKKPVNILNKSVKSIIPNIAGGVDTSSGIKTLEVIIKGFGGRISIKEINKKLAALPKDRIDELIKSVRGLTQEGPTTFSKFLEFWQAGLLSSIPTHIANITGNFAQTALRPLEAGISGAINPALSIFNKKKRTRFLGESAATAIGSITGFREGMHKALHALVREMPDDALTKTQEVLGRKAIGGISGQIVRSPFRLLTAADEFFKAINQNAGIWQLAYRKAATGSKSKGFAGLIDEASKIINNPSAGIIKAASKETLERVFQTPVNEIGGRFGKVVTSLGQAREDFPIVKMIVPFYRTPINLMRTGLKFTPLNAINLAVQGRRSAKIAKNRAKFLKLRKEFKDRNFTPDMSKLERGVLKGKKALELGDVTDDLAKMSIGSTIGALSFTHVLEGNITGRGPNNHAERRAWLVNHRPYSVKIFDTWISYERIEPIATTIGSFADAGEFLKFANFNDSSRTSWEIMIDDVISPGLFSIGKNLTSKTFTKGIADMLDAVRDPDRFGDQWVKGISSSLIPGSSLVGSIARARDPILRETEGVWEGIKSKVPGVYGSLSLKPIRDIWGRPIARRSGGFAEALISPFPRTNAIASDLDKELNSLDIFPGQAGDKISVMLGGNSVEVQMRPNEYDERLEHVGGVTMRVLDNITSSSNYKKLPAIFKQKLIKKIISYIRRNDMLLWRVKLMSTKAGIDRLMEARRQQLISLNNAQGGGINVPPPREFEPQDLPLKIR